MRGDGHFLFLAGFGCGWRFGLGNRRGVGREKEAYSPPGSAVDGRTDGERGVHGMGTPRRKNEASWLRTGSGTRKGSSLPARYSWRMGKPAGSGVSAAGVFPAERTKQAGRGRGVGREKEAYSPPGLAGGRGDRRGVGCPRSGYSPPKERSKLAAGGEWDAKRKLIARPV